MVKLLDSLVSVPKSSTASGTLNAGGSTQFCHFEQLLLWKLLRKRIHICTAAHRLPFRSLDGDAAAQQIAAGGIVTAEVDAERVGCYQYAVRGHQSERDGKPLSAPNPKMVTVPVTPSKSRS